MGHSGFNSLDVLNMSLLPSSVKDDLGKDLESSWNLIMCLRAIRICMQIFHISALGNFRNFPNFCLGKIDIFNNQRNHSYSPSSILKIYCASNILYWGIVDVQYHEHLLTENIAKLQENQYMRNIFFLSFPIRVLQPTWETIRKQKRWRNTRKYSRTDNMIDKSTNWKNNRGSSSPSQLYFEESSQLGQPILRTVTSELRTVLSV